MIALEFLQWGLLLLVGAATAVNTLILYKLSTYGIRFKLAGRDIESLNSRLADALRQIELNKPSHPGSPLHD